MKIARTDRQRLTPDVSQNDHQHEESTPLRRVRPGYRFGLGELVQLQMQSPTSSRKWQGGMRR